MNTKESIIECVPNFSEGTDVAAVREIVHAMQVTASPCWTTRSTPTIIVPSSPSRELLGR